MPFQELHSHELSSGFPRDFLFASVHIERDFHILSFLTVLLAFSHGALLCGDPKVLPLVKCLVTHIILLEDQILFGKRQTHVREMKAMHCPLLWL